MIETTRQPSAVAADILSRLFARLPHTPTQHFALYFYGALLRVATHAISHFGSSELLHERLPFLTGYLDELGLAAHRDADLAVASTEWRNAIETWEVGAQQRLPIADLRRAATLDHEDIILLVQIGLSDEDPRFAHVFDLLQGAIGERRPTPALLGAMWPVEMEFDARASAHRLRALGLVEKMSGESGALRPCATAWDALRGSAIIARDGIMQHRPVSVLPNLDALVIDAPLRADCEAIPGMLESGTVNTVLLRGPRHNGRRTLAAAIAARMGKGVLDVSAFEGPEDSRWRTAASVACLVNAVLVTNTELGPSDVFVLPDLPNGLASLFVTLGVSGGVGGPLADRAVSLRVPMPTPAARARLWHMAFGADPGDVQRLRMTSGNIVRAAGIARVTSRLRSDASVDDAAVRSAIRTLERPGLEALARRVQPSGDWSQLAVPANTRVELASLATRCRHRERLASIAGDAYGQLGPGVRALFKGPSGTGKTFAARLLAGMLGMDLYRVDLSAVVNKYIGETEKNLERVFARAEELDIVLLLDEGDALLTQRTGVHNANDRYANLETNYLLQRLESYEGIIFITTNAPDRIDGAFQRRMDAVVDFPLPDVSERWSIWQLHLPENNVVDAELLQSVAQRCALSGGQIRNVALHAALLALEADAPVGSDHIEAAIEREYRRQGALSPLRPRSTVR